MIPIVKTIALLIILAFSVMPIQAGDKPEKADQEPLGVLSVTLDRKSAHVGDTVNLTLRYTLPAGSKLTAESKLEGLEELTVIDQQIANNEIKLTIIVDQIETFDIGPLSFSFEDEEGVKTIIKSEPVTLTVLSNLGDKPAEAQLKPIMDIMPITPLWLKYLPWILGFIIIASIIGGIIWWRKKRQREMEEIQALKPAHIIAQEAIRNLQTDSLFDKGQYKEFYFRLSEIIRQYLEKIRDFPAAEYTTEEIAKQIKNDVDTRIVPLLREADLVKFADAIPSPARKDEDIKAALGYIKDSSPALSTEQHDITATGGDR